MGQGKALWSLGQLADALASYDAALEIEPDCSESLMNRGDILLVLGRRDEGVVSLRRAMGSAFSRTCPSMPSTANL